MAVKFLQEPEDKQIGIEYFETLMTYIFNAGKNLTRADVMEMLEKIETTYRGGSEVAKGSVEVFREAGLIRGIERGIEIGISLFLI
jgi:hypothetical protein